MAYVARVQYCFPSSIWISIVNLTLVIAAYYLTISVQFKSQWIVFLLQHSVHVVTPTPSSSVAIPRRSTVVGIANIITPAVLRKSEDSSFTMHYTSVINNNFWFRVPCSLCWIMSYLELFSWLTDIVSD